MTASKGLVLVTGANGFIGARTVEAFLHAGYSVRGTVRAPTSATDVLNALSDYAASGKLTTVVVPDITVPGAFDDAVQGVTAVTHIASDVSLTDPNFDYVIGTAIKGTVGILESSFKEPGLKAFVYMSSIVTLHGFGPKFHGRTITEADWNCEAEEVLQQGRGKEGMSEIFYIVSKIRAEKAFWEFREKHSHAIKVSMSTIHPVWVGGPPLILPDDPSKISTTASVTYYAMAGQDIPQGLGNGSHVDVRDVAQLLVFAVDKADVANGKRLIAGGSGNFANVQAHYDVLRKSYQGRKGEIREGTPGDGYLPDYSYPPGSIKVDSTKTSELFGQGWISFDRMVLDAAKAYEKYS